MRAAATESLCEWAGLPLAHVLESKVFVVHGGLFWQDYTFKDINKFDRFQEIPITDRFAARRAFSL